MRSIFFGKYSLVCALLLTAAGCGFQQVQPPVPTVAPTIAVPTPVPAPTYHVTGGAVALTVNVTPLPTSTFKHFLHSELQQQASQTTTKLTPVEISKKTLGQMIQYEVAIQQADNRGIGPTPAQVTKQINLYIKSSGGTTGCGTFAACKVTFQKQLKTIGWDATDVHFVAEATVAQQHLVKALFPLLKNGPVATGRTILVASNQRPGAIPALFYPAVTPPIKDQCENTVLTSSEARTEAQKFINEINGGKTTFSKLAKKCSDDILTAANGGVMTGGANTSSLYPYMQLFTPPFESAVFKGPVGKLQLVGAPGSPNASTGNYSYGWNVVQVTKRHNSKFTSALSAQIQADQFNFWITQQSAVANVKVLVIVA